MYGVKDSATVSELFKKMKADDRLLCKSNVTYVPERFYEYLYSNYNNKYIPLSSLEKALLLLNMSAAEFYKDKTQDEDDETLFELFD